MRQGFTLLELMIVVVIVGILAAIAIPSFRQYVYRSKVTQGITTLGEIRQRQEAYRAEFGQYCNVNGFASPTPATIPTGAQVTFTPTPEWRMLGVTAPRFTYFSYATAAGAPGATPTGAGWTSDVGINGAFGDFWFVAAARGDLDGDGMTFFLEIYSPTDGLYNSQPGGWE
jgi:prepilin-type N-terminal cleavage/methylation domain-containing protein